MTLLYATGFDLYTTYADASAQDGWAITQTGNNAGPPTQTIQTTNGRFGGGCLAGNNASNNGSILSKRTMGTLGTGGIHTFLGAAILMPVGSGGTNPVGLFDGASNQIGIDVLSDGTIAVIRGAVNIGQTAAGVFTLGTYHYLELDVVIGSGTSGSVTVRLDAHTVLTLSATNTQATANASWSVLMLASAANSFDLRIDDVYVCDSNGSVNNTFLGDVSIKALFPNTNGANSGFTRTGGSASGNYTAVNEKPNDGDTSYVASTTPSTIDTYKYPTLPLTVSAVNAVQARAVARKDDAGIRHITARYRHTDNTEADFSATDGNLTSTYTSVVQIQELNPRTGVAWTTGDLSGGEFGPRISL